MEKFLDMKLVLSVLSVTHIYHIMFIWKEKAPWFEIFGSDNVPTKKTFIQMTV